ncbi:MAG: fatty acid desaturase [Pseudobdellovibrionaceae bacterium]
MNNKEIIRILSPRVVEDLHRPHHTLDALALSASIICFALLVTLLAILPFGFLWMLCLIAQGFAIQILGLVKHDLFMHRQWGGPKWSYIGELVLGLPLTSPPTAVKVTHMQHHFSVNTDEDTEAYKQDLDSLWKRWIFLTAPGVALAMGRLFASRKTRGYLDIEKTVTPKIAQKIRFEKKLLLGYFIFISILVLYWPQFIFFGYILPMLISAPIASTFRTILEHFEVNPENPIHLATYYKTGRFSRLLFFWDSGDCHLIHHLFPRLPWYRMKQALEVMHPILMDAGVIERKNFWLLAKEWLIKGHPHRSLLTEAPESPKLILSVSR